MKLELQTADARMRRRIDALVCGELANEERRELLDWLDADASRWRACGLAFLESQVWEEALEETGARSQEPGARSQEPGTGCQPRNSVPRNDRRRWSVSLLVVAASIAAFVCGLVAQDLWHGSRQITPPIAQPDPPTERSPSASGPLVASVPVKGGPLGDIAATLQIPVRPVDSTAGQAASSIPDRIRRQWERRGYELVEERRYLPARLPDGRQVMVPVNEVKMKFVGKPVS